MRMREDIAFIVGGLRKIVGGVRKLAAGVRSIGAVGPGGGSPQATGAGGGRSDFFEGV